MTDLPAGLSASLDALWRTIGARARGADPESSYTARLLANGVDRIAQKVGEEATETVIAAVRGAPQAIVAESADLLYHLLVLWQAAGVEPDAVAAELEKRARPPGASVSVGRSSGGGPASGGDG